MIVETSAIVAVLEHEPGCERLQDAIDRAPSVCVPATALAEASVVLGRRRGKDVRPLLDGFLRANGATVLAFGDDHWRVAAEAFLRYGRGRHPAQLNYGDCLSYAAAKVSGLPLLYVGDDFAQTDVQAA